MPEQDVVLTERRGGVGIVYLNRPKQLNAWTGQMQTLCFNALDAMEADPLVRVIVLTGKGHAFCAGADLGILSGASKSRDAKPMADDAEQSLGMADRDVLYPMTILKPVIAAVNGAVAGIGLSLALACDMRFATPHAKFLGAFSRRGLVAEYGISSTLPRLVGTGNAMMFLMSSDTCVEGRCGRGGDFGVVRFRCLAGKARAMLVCVLAVAREECRHGFLAAFARAVCCCLPLSSFLAAVSVRGPFIVFLLSFPRSAVANFK
jgi:hypothetical protein